MTESPPSLDRESLFLILITLLILIVILGLVSSLMRRAREARWPGGKVGGESFFNLSNLFPAHQGERRAEKPSAEVPRGAEPAECSTRQKFNLGHLGNRPALPSGGLSR
jgi:hypothetical protein